MPALKEKTLSEVKQRLEKAMARLDKAVFKNSERFDDLKEIEKKQQELEALEVQLVSDANKKTEKLEALLKTKEEAIKNFEAVVRQQNLEIENLNKKLTEKTGSSSEEAAKVTSLERETQILRTMLEEEKAVKESLQKTGGKVSEQLDLLIKEVDEILNEKIV